MKKCLVFISLLVSLFFFSFVNKYEAKTLECYYKVPLRGSSSYENNPIVKLKFDDSNGLSIVLNRSKLQLFDFNNRFTVSENNKVGDYFIMLGEKLNLTDLYLNDYDMENNPNGGLDVCPDLTSSVGEDKNTGIHVYEGMNKGDRVNIIKLYSVNGGYQFGANTKLILVDSNGNEIDGDKYNKDEKTTCKIEYPASKLLNNNNLTNIFDIEISTYKDGRIYVSVDGNGDYISNVPDKNNIVWQEFSSESGSHTFIIRESEIKDIKDAFPYKGNCSKLIITPVDIKGTFLTRTYYAISVNPISDGKQDGVIIDGSYDVNKDPNFDFNFEISDNTNDYISLCTKYIGHASEEDTIANLLDKIYTLIKLGSIILVIVFSLVDFASVITNSKDDLMNVIKKSSKRLIILVIILLLPFLIDLVCGLFGFPDILCGIK